MKSSALTNGGGKEPPKQTRPNLEAEIFCREMLHGSLSQLHADGQVRWVSADAEVRLAAN